MHYHQQQLLCLEHRPFFFATYRRSHVAGELDSCESVGSGEWDRWRMVDQWCVIWHLYSWRQAIFYTKNIWSTVLSMRTHHARAFRSHCQQGTQHARPLSAHHQYAAKYTSEHSPQHWAGHTWKLLDILTIRRTHRISNPVAISGTVHAPPMSEKKIDDIDVYPPGSSGRVLTPFHDSKQGWMYSGMHIGEDVTYSHG